MARNTRRQLEHARSMRKSPTWGELRLWESLRRSRLGVPFRRQEPIGPYIVDFLCRTHRLILEVDGMTHHYGDDAYAQRRDHWLRTNGWVVLHFDSEEVDKHLEDVLATIRIYLDL